MKMKKIFYVMAVLSAVFSAYTITGNAAPGDVLGAVLHTDIVAYINHYAIDSFAFNGQSLIAADDLVNYGFDVNWDNSTRSLTISRNNSTKISPMGDGKYSLPGTRWRDILESDIKVYANGVQLTSYTVDGFVMIPIEEMTVFGSINWDAPHRAIKLWIEGLQMSPKMEEPKTETLEKQIYYYLLENYGSLTTPLGTEEFDFLVYKNDYSYSAMDYNVYTYFDYSYFYDVKTSINYTYSQKEQAKAQIRWHQETLAKDLISRFPNLKFKGGYWWNNSSRGRSAEAYTWCNYSTRNPKDYNNTYYNSYITPFKWIRDELLHINK